MVVLCAVLLPNHAAVQWMQKRFAPSSAIIWCAATKPAVCVSDKHAVGV